MAVWGFLTLGACAALMTGTILTRVRSNGAIELLLALSPVYTSASLVFFNPALQSSGAFAFYSTGLLISFMWQQAWPMLDRIPSDAVKKRLPMAVCSTLLFTTGILVVCALCAT